MMGQEDEQQGSGFAGMTEKFSIDYLTQIAEPMRTIKDTYSRLRREWKRLSPLVRVELYHMMEAKWEILKTSTTSVCEISGYPFVARLKQVEIVVRRELKERMLQTIEADQKSVSRNNPHPCNQHSLKDETAELHWRLKDLESYMALDRMLRLVGESERALYKCGVLLSPMYAGHDLLGDIRGEISEGTEPLDMGIIPMGKAKKNG